MRLLSFLSALVIATTLSAQTLLNIDFGVGKASAKTGFAATGQATNDFWNLYRHYEPKFVPGMKLVADGKLDNLKLADGSDSKISVTVSNAPGVWGNTSGDPMYDTFIFAQNGSNLTVTLTGLNPGHYHVYLYGHADPDVTGEQNSSFILHSGTNTLGPLTQLGSTGWKESTPWQERYQYVVFRDVPVLPGTPLLMEVTPGPNGVAVLNGMQIISRGTSPPRLVTPLLEKAPFVLTNLMLREAHFDGKVTDTEARFTVRLSVESMTTNEISAPLFEGDVAVVAPEIPDGLRIVNSAKKYRLIAATPGAYSFKLDLVAKITKAEPWNQISFTGPNASIASVNATASAPGIEMQLLSGTQLDPDQKATSKLSGFLGPDRVLAMRWQSKATEVTRKSLVTVDTLASAQITPTVIKFNTQFRYEILQAPVPKLTLEIPKTQALTKLQGDQIRDWSVKVGQASSLSIVGQASSLSNVARASSLTGEVQILTVEFIKPVEKSYSLTLFSEQTVETTPLTASLLPPQPLEIERESGSFSLSADDMLVDIDSATGLRQVNAASGTLAAYRFFGRPFTLLAKLKRIEPVVKVADRVTARLEETRLLVAHALTLNVEKAGIYSVELTPQTNFVVADIRGEGVDDWKVTDGKLKVSFASRILGARKLDVQLEQPQKAFPEQITVAPLHVTGATNETAQIGAAAALGIRLKTAGELTGLREIPVSALQSRTGVSPVQNSQQGGTGGTPVLPSDESLAFSADQTDWKLTLAAERLPARIMADLFNLITIGDGVVGGSATIRYGLINQGVQEFKVRLPRHWKNVEFTGPNIRRKETNTPPAGTTDTNSLFWTISLQDKVWGGYTLVVTYDYQFDPKRALLDLSGAHVSGVERETGTVALTAAASMELEAKSADPLRLIDQTELAEADRALITRPVLRAYRYTGDNFKLSAALTRHAELTGLLDAVADRTQITSVLTEEGQMLTQASFMVKNSDKQFQKFRLPRGAKLWGCYVNNDPVKAEQDGEWLLVSLPRGANRDEAFAVDIKYEQKLDSLKHRVWPHGIALSAPKSDVPNTYAEWQLHVPATQRLSSFDGNMTVARGTVYGLREAWQRFTTFYGDFFRDYGAGLIIYGGITLLVISLLVGWSRRGFKGIGTVIVLFCLLFVMAGMFLPALSKSKAMAQRVNAVSNLKQIALAARMWANDNNETLPTSFEQMKNELGTDKVLRDPQTGEQFVWVGTGKRTDNPQAIIAYSPVDVNGRAVAFADGSVQQMTSEQFARALEVDRQVAQSPAPPGLALQQAEAIRGQQFSPALAVNAPAQMPAAQPSAPALAPPMGGQGGGGGGLAGRSAGGVVIAGGNASGIQPIQAVGGVSAADFFDSSGARIPGAAGGAAPTTAGLRSIKIDVPLSGVAYHFTKVLNVSDEPLEVKLSIEPRKSFQVRRSTLQLLAFLVGLLVTWREWHRRPARGWALALGLALGLGSVGHLLIAARVLHLAFMAAVPALALLILIWLLQRYWPRHRPAPSPQAEPGTAPGAPPAVAGLILLLSASAFLTAPALAQDAANDQAATRTPQFTILSATYIGAVKEKVAQFDATLQIATFTTNQTIALFGDDVAIQEFSTDAKEVNLLRDGRTVSVRLPDRGSAKVQAKLVVKLGGDVTKRQLTFAIPSALASKLTMTIDEGDADVEFPTAVSFQRKPEAKQTRVEAILGAGDRVELFWTPRMKRATEMAASVFAQNTALVTVGGGVVNTHATLDYQITQGELRQVKVRLPAGQRLLRVDGEFIRVWELKDEAAGQVLSVDLVKAVSPNYKLTVETEKLLDKLPAPVKVEVPHVLEVIRETGLVGLRGSEELSLTIEAAADLQRVDAAEFAKVAKAEELISAYRFLKPSFQLTARAEAIQPQIEAVVYNATRIGFENILLTSKVDYTIKKAGVFALRLALPAGYKVDSVTGGSGALPWAEKDNPRTLEVTLKERTQGPFNLRVVLTKAHKELPKTVEIAGMLPLETSKLTGYVSVSSEPGVAVKTTTFEALTEIPAAQLEEGRTGVPPVQQLRQPETGGTPVLLSAVLAFKLIGTDPKTAAQWKLTVATETVESWVRAEVVNIVSVTETLLSGRALVRFDIQNAPVKDFRVKVPTAYTNVEIFGTNIRRRDHNGAEWKVELQNKVRGLYTLTVTWEKPRDAKTNAVIELAGVETIGAERETGFVVLLAKPPLQVAEKSATDQLLKIDPRELPDWAGVSATAPNAAAEVPVLVYRYLRPNYTVALEARRFEEAALLQALVDSAQLTTVIADDGQMMTEMVLNIRNNGRQHLAVELPPKTTVWSAFVAGQPVRPSQPSTNSSQLLLPLERTGAGDAPIAVELTYVGTEKFPKTKGRVEMLSPKLDVPLKNARWDLYLPPDYDYTKFEGSMTHQEQEGAAPMVQLFSSTEYFKQEQQKKAVRRFEVTRALGNVKSQLAAGNYWVANGEYNNALVLNADGDVAAKKELEGLQKDLKRVQGSNLIQAQRAYTARNVGKYAAADQPQAGQVTQQAEQAAQMVQYDQEVAERQVAQLQKAQQLTVAKVQPLRANLPTRGLRHAFTQVLQTEVNKPMTIEFTAANAKEIGWFKRFLYAAGGFLMLWIFSAVVLQRALRESPTPA